MCELCQALKDNINEKQEILNRFNDDLVAAVMLLKKAVPPLKACKESERLADTIENFLLK